MTYMVLCRDLTISTEVTLSESGSYKSLIWESGHRINTKEHDLSRLEFLCETEHPPPFVDYAVSDLGCILVSERLRTIFKSVGMNNLQYFSVIIKQSDQKSITTGYYAVNIIGLIDCIDDNKSKLIGVEKIGDPILEIETLGLKIPKGGYSCKIFRAHRFRRLIIIDNIIQKQIIDNKITGLKLVEAEKWDGFDGETI
jgi:hypothetical protein